jgi:very-short-patch-repair endonuclease
VRARRLAGCPHTALLVHSSRRSGHRRAKRVDRDGVAFSTSGLHGAYRRADLLRECGRRRLDHALRAGVLRPLWCGIVVEAGRELDVRTRAAAALLTTNHDAVICGPTAAVLNGCTALSSADTHVLVPYSRNPKKRPGLVVHHGSFYRDQVVVLDGLRVLSLPQVIADLVCLARPADALAVGDEALRLAEPACDDFRAAVADRIRARPDPRGGVRGAFLWELASPRAESAAESWTRMLLIEQGFPLPDVNFRILSPAGRELYRLDLAWPSLRIAVEYDGHAVHADRDEQDAARDEDLRRRGWIVVHVKAADLADPARFLAELRRAFARRGYSW